MTGQPIVFVVTRYSEIMGVFTSESAACDYADRLLAKERGNGNMQFERVEVTAAPFVVSPGAYSEAYEPVKAGDA
ncbi:MAG: hypothetical protein IJ113_01145 [Eggerthellaceae bacterium]|nr:hypothetical protein [Eggerthellaceae bacterium]